MLLSMKLTDISPAIALTPLDGRYHKQTAPLVEYMSEPALNRERMRVEVEWMILLANGFEGKPSPSVHRTLRCKRKRAEKAALRCRQDKVFRKFRYRHLQSQHLRKHA